MAHLYKPEYTKPLPPSATISKRKDGVYARVKYRGVYGWYPVTEDGGRVRITVDCWYVEYLVPGRDRPVRKPLSPDRLTAEQMRAELLLEIERSKHNQPMPPSPRDKTLDAWLDEWHQVLRDKGAADRWAALVRTRVKMVADGCGWLWPRDVDRDGAARYLASRLNGEDAAAPKMAPQTYNHYVAHLRAFGDWLAPKLRLASPLAELGRRALDRKARARRILSAGNFDRFVAATRASGRMWCGLDGVARAWLYLTAANTGYRVKELSVLTAAHFDLAGSPPVASLDAAATKNRTDACIPLPRQLAAGLAAWSAGKPAMWNGGKRWWDHAAKMLRRDLEESGLPYQDERGRYYDFHSLRHQYITRLAAAGVPLAFAQKLARHCTPTLTANYYTQAGLADLAEQVDKLDSGTS
jgi:integrase